MLELTPLIALAVLLLDAVADVLPDTPLFSVLTPDRLVLAVGLLAAVPTLRGNGLVALRRAWPCHLAAVAFLVAAAVPARTYGGWSEWRGLLTCVGIAYLAAAVMRSTVDSWRALTLLGSAAVATAGLAGVRQTVQGIPTGFCRGALDGTADSCGHPGVIVRALGTFGNPNLLAAFLVLFIPLAVSYAVGHPQRQSRVVAGLIGVVGAAGVLATGSRAGIMALVTSVCAYAVLRRPTTRRLVAGFGTVAALLVAGGVALVTGAGIGVRTDVWEAAVVLIQRYPLGVGWGRTGELLASVVPGNEQFRHAHNLWLDTLLATGPLGLAALIAITVLAAVAVVRAARHGSAAGVALGCSLAAFAVFCLVDNPVKAIRNAYAAWAVVGLALAAGHGVGYRRDEEVHAAGSREAHPLPAS